MDSYFQSGIKLQGTLKVKGTVHFDGDLSGEVFASDHLIIGGKGTVTGNIHTLEITNLGQIHGDVHAEHKVSLGAGSELKGDIHTFNLVVEEGSRFEGRCPECAA